MRKKIYGLTAVEIRGDLYTIGGSAANDIEETEINKISCTSLVCTWTTINQTLKVGRLNTVAVAVMDASCN